MPGRQRALRRRAAPLAEPRDLCVCVAGSNAAPTPVTIRRYGRRNGAPVLLLGAQDNRFVAGPHGWGQGLAQPGGPIDLGRFALLGADLSAARGPGLAPPLCDATLLEAALDELNLLPLYAVIGCGEGALAALRLAHRLGAMLDRLCVVAPPAGLCLHPRLAAIEAQTTLVACGEPKTALSELVPLSAAFPRLRTCHVLAPPSRSGVPRHEHAQLGPILRSFLLDANS